MTFTPRSYPEIVRDLLTVMTGGTVAESIDVGIDDEPLRPRLLADRPVGRVSHLEGFIALRKRSGDTELSPYRFGPTDFALKRRPTTGCSTRFASARRAAGPRPDRA